MKNHFGSPGDAVGFGATAATLEVEAGAVFVGRVGANAARTRFYSAGPAQGRSPASAPNSPASAQWRKLRAPNGRSSEPIL